MGRFCSLEGSRVVAGFLADARIALQYSHSPRTYGMEPLLKGPGDSLRSPTDSTVALSKIMHRVAMLVQCLPAAGQTPTGSSIAVISLSTYTP